VGCWRRRRGLSGCYGVGNGDGVRAGFRRVEDRRRNNDFMIGTNMLFFYFFRIRHTRSLWLNYPSKTFSAIQHPFVQFAPENQLWHDKFASTHVLAVVLHQGHLDIPPRLRTCRAFAAFVGEVRGARVGWKES